MILRQNNIDQERPRYKILCSGNLSFGQCDFMEKDFVIDINKEIYYEPILIGGTADRICVLMKKN
jgi:hypothetical protein